MLDANNKLQRPLFFMYTGYRDGSKFGAQSLS